MYKVIVSDDAFKELSKLDKKSKTNLSKIKKA